MAAKSKRARTPAKPTKKAVRSSRSRISNKAPASKLERAQTHVLGGCETGWRTDRDSNPG